MGIHELRGSLSRSSFAAEARRYVPEVSTAISRPHPPVFARKLWTSMDHSSTTFESTASGRSRRCETPSPGSGCAL
jgi:hypothetical protein